MDAGPLHDQLSMLRGHKVAGGSNVAVYGNVKGGRFAAYIADADTLDKVDRAVLNGFWNSSQESCAVALSLMSHLQTRKLVIDIDNKPTHGAVPIYPCEWLALAEYIRRVLSDMTARVVKLDVHLVKCGSKNALQSDRHSACSGCHLVVYNLGFEPQSAYRAVQSLAYQVLLHIGKVKNPTDTVSANTTIWKRNHTRIMVDGEPVSLGEISRGRGEQTGKDDVDVVVCGKASQRTQYVSQMGTEALQQVVDTCEEIVQSLFSAEQTTSHIHRVNVEDFFDVEVAYKCTIRSVFTKKRAGAGTLSYYAPFAHLDGERLSKTSFACFSCKGHQKVFCDNELKAIFDPETGKRLRWDLSNVPDWCQFTDRIDHIWEEVFRWMRRGPPLREPTEPGACGFVEANMKDHLIVFSSKQETAAYKYATAHAQLFSAEKPARADKSGAACDDAEDVFTVQDVTAIREHNRAVSAREYTNVFRLPTPSGRPEQNTLGRIASAKALHLIRFALAPPPSSADLQQCPIFSVIRQLASPVRQKPKPRVHLSPVAAWKHHTMTLYAACECFPATRALVKCMDGPTWRGLRLKRQGDVQFSHKPLDETNIRKTIQEALWAVSIPGVQDTACPFSSPPHNEGKKVYAFVHSLDPRSVTLRCNGQRALCEQGRVQFSPMCARQSNVVMTLPDNDVASLFTLLSYASVVYNATLLSTVAKWLQKAAADKTGALEHSTHTSTAPNLVRKRKVPSGFADKISIR